MPIGSLVRMSCVSPSMQPAAPNMPFSSSSCLLLAPPGSSVTVGPTLGIFPRTKLQLCTCFDLLHLQRGTPKFVTCVVVLTNEYDARRETDLQRRTYIKETLIWEVTSSPIEQFSSMPIGMGIVCAIWSISTRAKSG